MTDLVVAVKRCSACGETKPLIEYYKSRGSRDGLKSACKDCEKARAKDSRERQEQQLGTDVYRARRADIVRRHRDRTGNVRGRQWQVAREAAVRRLIENHRSEYEHLLAIEKYEAGLA